MRGGACPGFAPRGERFPFLFGGTFIEGPKHGVAQVRFGDFPSFSEGLSLRADLENELCEPPAPHFPSFSEGLSLRGTADEAH